MAKAAFVTGGSGFIGGKLVERLVGEGRSVRALARSDAAAERVALLGAEPVRGDLGDRGSLAAGAAGTEAPSTSPPIWASGARGRTSNKATSRARATRSQPAPMPEWSASSTVGRRQR